MRVLVTGASGFIGRHLVRRLVYEPDTELTLLALDRHPGHSLPAHLEDIDARNGIIQADLRDFEQIQQVISRVRPDLIYHLAAAGVGDPFLPVEDALSHNLFGTLNLLRASFDVGSHSHRPLRLIASRTPGEYSAMNPYAASKAAAWQFCRMYARTRGWPIVGAAIFQAYGPGQPQHRVLPSAITAALNGKEFPMTIGKQERDWIYISDVVAGLLAIRDAHLEPGKTVELGSGKLTSVAEVVQQVFTMTSSAGRPLFGALPTRSGEVVRQKADVERAFDRTGWRPAVKLESGLSKTIGYFGHRQNSPISDAE